MYIYAKIYIYIYVYIHAYIYIHICIYTDILDRREKAKYRQNTEKNQLHSPLILVLCLCVCMPRWRGGDR